MMDAYKGSGKYYDASGNVCLNGGPKDGMIRTEEDMQWVKDMIAAVTNSGRTRPSANLRFGMVTCSMPTVMVMVFMVTHSTNASKGCPQATRNIHSVSSFCCMERI